jgi:23S rRNA (pseudouridine1915-N3)-methyltransferase
LRLAIIAVGRLKGGPERSLIETYAARLKPAPARLGPLSIHDIDERKDAKRIGQAMRDVAARLSPGTRLVALDEHGSEMTTRGLAELLAAWRDEGTPEAAFLIGGADGLDEQIRAGSRLVLSLGRMTWPHRLARAMLAEQLYRAASLLCGHPYHRE